MRGQLSLTFSDRHPHTWGPKLSQYKWFNQKLMLVCKQLLTVKHAYTVKGGSECIAKSCHRSYNEDCYTKERLNKVCEFKRQKLHGGEAIWIIEKHILNKEREHVLVSILCVWYTAVGQNSVSVCVRLCVPLYLCGCTRLTGWYPASFMAHHTHPVTHTLMHTHTYIQQGDNVLLVTARVKWQHADCKNTRY